MYIKKIENGIDLSFYNGFSLVMFKKKNDSEVTIEIREDGLMRSFSFNKEKIDGMKSLLRKEGFNLPDRIMMIDCAMKHDLWR